MSVPTQFKLLMIDDEITYHELYKSIITAELNADIDFASNGLEALSMLSKCPDYDLLILDLDMPKLDGESTLKEIRLNPLHKYTPIYVLTANATHENQEKLLNLGANDFIAKGCPPEVFTLRLKNLMSFKKEKAELEESQLWSIMITASALETLEAIGAKTIKSIEACPHPAALKEGNNKLKAASKSILSQMKELLSRKHTRTTFGAKLSELENSLVTLKRGNNILTPNIHNSSNAAIDLRQPLKAYKYLFTCLYILGDSTLSYTLGESGLELDTTFQTPEAICKFAHLLGFKKEPNRLYLDFGEVK